MTWKTHVFLAIYVGIALFFKKTGYFSTHNFEMTREYLHPYLLKNK